MAKIIVTIEIDETADVPAVWEWLEEKFDNQYEPEGVISIEMVGE